MLGVGVWSRIDARSQATVLAHWAHGLKLGYMLLTPAAGEDITAFLTRLEEQEAAIHFSSARVRLLVGLPTMPHGATRLGELAKTAFDMGVDGVVALLDETWAGSDSVETLPLVDALLGAVPRWAREPAARGTYVAGAYAPVFGQSWVRACTPLARALDVLFLDGEWTRWPEGSNGNYGIAQRAACSQLLRSAPGANVAYVGPVKGHPWPGLPLTLLGVEAFLEMSLDGQGFAWMEEAEGCVLEILTARAELLEVMRKASSVPPRTSYRSLADSVPPSGAA